MANVLLMLVCLLSAARLLLWLHENPQWLLPKLLKLPLPKRWKHRWLLKLLKL